MAEQVVSSASSDAETTLARPPEQAFRIGLSRYHFMPRPIKIIFITSSLVALVLFILFWFSVPIFGEPLRGNFYYYLLYATLGFNLFMALGATRKQKQMAPPWYDYVLALTLWGILIFFMLNEEAITAKMWVVPPTNLHLALSVIVGLMALEAARRVGGWGMVGMLCLGIVYPLIADKMPGILEAIPFSFERVMGDYAFGANGMLGMPARIVGNLIIGFYFFAGIMMGIGGGDFFLKLALALAGRFRGGPAKVAVLASGFFGSLSGSVIANIAGTGSFTIPAMKRMGYEPEYAGAIEACASTGGDTMPPIMGGIWMMIIITGSTYADVLVAAIIPSFLFYSGLLIQVDGYAVTHNLKGMPREEIPAVWTVVKDGWIYLVCIGFLVLGLVYFRWGVIVPVYAVGLMVLLSFTSKKTRLTWKRVEMALAQYASLLNFAIGIFLGLGFMMVGLLKTGVAAAIASWVVSLGGENLILVLVIGVIFALIMGMVGLDKTAYLFLAVTLAPAVVEMGNLSIIAVHLFLIMYGGMGGLTPPVAVYAYIASGIANADPIKTSYRTVRLGIVLALFPFFFVFQPALIILDSSPADIFKYLSIAIVGLWLLTSGLEGYLLKVGKLRWWERLLLIPGGFLFAFPDWQLTIYGAIICSLTIISVYLKRKLVPKLARSQ